MRMDARKTMGCCVVELSAQCHHHAIISHRGAGAAFLQTTQHTHTETMSVRNAIWRWYTRTTPTNTLLRATCPWRAWCAQSKTTKKPPTPGVWSRDRNPWRSLSLSLSTAMEMNRFSDGQNESMYTHLCVGFALSTATRVVSLSLVSTLLGPVSRVHSFDIAVYIFGCSWGKSKPEPARATHALLLLSGCGDVWWCLALCVLLLTPHSHYTHLLLSANQTRAKTNANRAAHTTQHNTTPTQPLTALCRGSCSMCVLFVHDIAPRFWG